MSDVERLQHIALALADAIAAREDGKQVKLPVIQRGDAARLMHVMHAQLDHAIAQRTEQIGERLACTMGCNACCKSPVLVTEGEAIAIVEWLRDPEHADVRARFEAAYPRWRTTLGELVDQAGDPRLPDQTKAWCLAVQQRQAMCAFNHDGLCSIYPVRPALCRKAHALDTSANCSSDREQVQYYEHKQTEELYESQNAMRFALHMAVRPNGSVGMLCSAVHRLLAGAAAGRNDPCPCGSEKKFKKCCGANR